MKMRVAIARAMALEPDILLMDEPFAALDALTRRTMQRELLALWDQLRFTVLFVTHSIEEAIIVGSRILVLSPHPGRVRAELNAEGLDHNSIGKAEFGALSKRINHLLFGEDRKSTSARGRPGVTENSRQNPVRAEREVDLVDAGVIGDVERPLTVVERVVNNEAVQRLDHSCRDHRHLGALRTLAEQRVAVSDLHRDGDNLLERRRQWRARGPDAHIAAHAGNRLHFRTGAGGHF